MSVEYRYYLVPKPNSFLPTSSRLRNLLQRTSDSWVRHTAWLMRSQGKRNVNRESVSLDEAIKEVSDRPLQEIRISLPFVQRKDENSIDLEVHISSGAYVYHTSETVGPFKSSACKRCGAELVGDRANIFQEPLILASCPRCGVRFDPSRMRAVRVDPWSGRKSVVVGGTTYRFALIFANVLLPEQRRFMPPSGFVKLSEEILKCQFRGLADIL